MIDTMSTPKGVEPGVKRDWHEWRQVAGADKGWYMPYMSRCSIGEAFWRTLARDCDYDFSQSTLRRLSPLDLTKFVNWWEDYCATDSADSEPQLQKGFGDDDRKENLRLLKTHIAHINAGKRLFKSRRGYIGTVPETALPGDLICVVVGGRVPLVLRLMEMSDEMRNSEDRRYTFVGDCYVHGIMDGEAMYGSDGSLIALETFTVA